MTDSSSHTCMGPLSSAITSPSLTLRLFLTTLFSLNFSSLTVSNNTIHTLIFSFSPIEAPRNTQQLHFHHINHFPTVSPLTWIVTIHPSWWECHQTSSITRWQVQSYAGAQHHLHWATGHPPPGVTRWWYKAKEWSRIKTKVYRIVDKKICTCSHTFPSTTMVTSFPIDWICCPGTKTWNVQSCDRDMYPYIWH